MKGLEFVEVDVSEEDGRAWTPEGIDMILEAKRKITEFIDEYSIPEWIGLRQGCEMKGIAYETVRKRRYAYLRPPIQDARRINGERKWHKSVIRKWLLRDDEGKQFSPIG